MTGSEHVRRVSDWLTRHGATDIRLLPGGKHPKLIYLWKDGASWDYPMPSSPGDRHGWRSAICALKHRHELVGSRRVGEPRKGRSLASRKAAQPLRHSPPQVERRDWHDDLKRLLNG